MEDIVLRRGSADDAEALAQLSLESSSYYASIAPETFAPGDADGFADWIGRTWQDEPNTLSLVADIEGAVAGYLEAVIQEPEDWRRFFGDRGLRGRRLQINALLTAERYRRRGVATRLVDAAEQWARDRGAVVATLDTFHDSPLSVPFWEGRMGYQRHAIVFRKHL